MRTRIVTHAGLALQTDATRGSSSRSPSADEINSYRFYCLLLTLHKRAKADFLWSHSHRCRSNSGPQQLVQLIYLVANNPVCLNWIKSLNFLSLLINNIESLIRLLFWNLISFRHFCESLINYIYVNYLLFIITF